MEQTASFSATAKPNPWNTAKTVALVLSRLLIIGLLLLIGGLKWTHAEAVSLQNWVSHSPFLSWLYRILSVDGASRAIGVTELIIAALLLARHFSPLACFVGSVGAVGMFLTTLSFLFTTPGAWITGKGFPVPTAESWFLVKDVVLLAISVWSADEAWRAMQARRAKGVTL